jgi:hypothetical protein|nr:MAG TPA: hypothetical protein [Caudoviricetes sp.]
MKSENLTVGLFLERFESMPLSGFLNFLKTEYSIDLRSKEYGSMSDNDVVALNSYLSVYIINPETPFEKGYKSFREVYLGSFGNDKEAVKFLKNKGILDKVDIKATKAFDILDELAEKRVILYIPVTTTIFLMPKYV